MATRFDHPIVYEDRDELHTSRWRLEGVVTREEGPNTDRGWLWMECTDADDTVTVNLYKDSACAVGDLVATGTVDISGLTTAAAKCTLSAATSSGLSGSFYVEDYDSDPASAVPVCVCLCTDIDLETEYRNLDDLPDDVYDATTGMARYCAAATGKVLRLVSQMYAEEVGGYGASETRVLLDATRKYPDFRCIAQPEQLKDAAIHWALSLAFGSCHERASETMYSELRDYHDQQRREAVSAWRLAINSDPDNDHDADESKASSMVRPVRL